MRELKFQIGKKGVTQGVIDFINTSFKTHNQLRISILKSLSRSKEEIEKMASEMKDKLNYACNYKVLGFTIILKRQSKHPKSDK